MAAAEQFTSLHRAAPPKVAMGAPCNGCGVCCAARPCPLSYLLLGHRTDPCAALQWNAPQRRYFCGMLIAPAGFLPWLPPAWQASAGRLFCRWIAAGVGCDTDIAVE